LKIAAKLERIFIRFNILAEQLGDTCGAIWGHMMKIRKIQGFFYVILHRKICT